MLLPLLVHLNTEQSNRYPWIETCAICLASCQYGRCAISMARFHRQKGHGQASQSTFWCPNWRALCVALLALSSLFMVASLHGVEDLAAGANGLDMIPSSANPFYAAPFRDPATLSSLSNEEENVELTSPYTTSSYCKAQGCSINLPKKLTFPRQDQPTIDHTSPINNNISGHCTLKGQKGRGSQNQDRSVLVETPNGFLVGLFDGHGINGETSSTVASQLLPRSVLDSDKRFLTADSFYSIFLNADSEVVQADGGTTAFVILQEQDKIHVAWVGDSSAYVVRWPDNRADSSTYELTLQTEPHKPANPQEQDRIESNGGRIFVPMNPVESSRVFYVEKDNIGREMEFGLAMSRSLGDKGGKLSKVLTARPSYLSFELPNSGDYFVVLASDGVGDMIPKDVLLGRLGDALFSDSDENGQYLGHACEEIVFQAAEVWHRETGGTYRDDISLLFRKVVRRPSTREDTSPHQTLALRSRAE